MLTYLKKKYECFSYQRVHSVQMYLDGGHGPCYVIQIKYVLLCHLPQYEYGSRVRLVPGWWDPGIPTNTGAGDTVLANTQSILIIAYILTLFWHHHCAATGIMWGLWVAAESAGMWSGAPHTTHYYANHYC